MIRAILFWTCLCLFVAAPVMAQSGVEITDSTSGIWTGGQGGGIDPNHPAIKIMAQSYTRVYGDANPDFEFTSEGATLVGVPEIICEATASSPVGTYPILIKEGSVSNHNVTYEEGKLTITKAPLTVKAENATREQYQENPDFVITYSGWKVNDNENVLTKRPTATTTAKKDSPVGDYEIVVTGGEASNYDLSYQNGTLTVVESSGISEIDVTHPVDIYTLQGNKVRSKVTSLENLPNGVYIVNSRKIVVTRDSK